MKIVLVKWLVLVIFKFILIKKKLVNVCGINVNFRKLVVGSDILC